jgi:hypothetical protein
MGGMQPMGPVQGTIIDVNPQSALCTVKTDLGQLLFAALPGFSHDPDGGGGCLEVPRRGQDVIIEFGLGHPYIVRYLASSTDVDITNEGTYSITEFESLGEGFATSDASNFIGRLPKDTLPGDFIRIGNQGQALGILDEGVGLLRSAPWAQIRTIATPADEVVQIFGRNTEIHSGFGTLAFKHQAGKSYMKLEGGTDQLLESGAEVNNFTTRVQIGGDISGLASVKLSDRNGAIVYGNDIGYDGSIIQTQRGSLTQKIEQNALYDHGDMRFTMIRRGDDVLQVLNGNRTEDFRGSRESLVSGNTRLFTGRDLTITAQRDGALFAGRKLELNASGDELAKPGDIAAQWSVTNGDLIFDVGNPTKLDLQKSQSSIAGNVWSGGNIIFWPMRPPGKFIVPMNGPDCIALGAAPLVYTAPFHAVLYEMFNALMTTLGGWLDAHVHPTSVGPSGPPTPPWSSLGPPALIQACRSQLVTFGG